MSSHKNYFISIILLTYNSEDYIEDSLISLINQDYANFQIVISDDCSTDSTVEIIKRVIKQIRVQVVFNKNDSNLGIGGNLNKAMSLCDGDIVVAAAGDDLSRKDRLTQICKAFNRKEVMLVFSDYSSIDENGFTIKAHNVAPIAPIHLWHFLKSDTSLIFGASAAWRSEVFETFGKLRLGLGFEDRVIMARALMLGKVVRLSHPLVIYRIHSKSITQASRKLASNDRYIHNFINMNEVYLSIRQDMVRFKYRYLFEYIMVKRKIHLFKTYTAFLRKEIGMSRLILNSIVVAGNPLFLLSKI